MHTGASPMYTEMNMYSEQEQNSISSIMTANAYRNPDMQMCTAHMTRKTFQIWNR